MNNVGFMQILNSFDQLVKNVTIVKIFEDFLSDSIVEICLHELKNQVQIFIVFRSNDSVEFDNVLVIDLVEEDDFAVGALGVGGMLKGVKYFF